VCCLAQRCGGAVGVEQLGSPASVPDVGPWETSGSCQPWGTSAAERSVAASFAPVQCNVSNEVTVMY